MKKKSAGGDPYIFLDYRKKDRNKAIKTVLQLIFLAIIAYVLYHALFDVKRYAEPSRAEWTSDNGFIALSYFGVARSGTNELIAKNRLEQHLQALYDNGYTTISQQDVLNYYAGRQKLPEKALFLAFEDGRNDSSLFSQPLLEKLNYKATILSYASKVDSKEKKFLHPKEMKKMLKTGYWELGSNGYRLSYINIMDKAGNLIGVKDEDEFKNRDQIAYYNHYLMDFIRDADDIPMENREQMEARINGDYDKMKEIYTSRLGSVPSVYMIMHANSLYGGMNRLVEGVNDRRIRELFGLHFNREGFALNGRTDDPYDLTRVQPASYWYTNHLLMKLNKDSGQRMSFVAGDVKRAAAWRSVSGAAEYVENKIALTSPPEEEGLLYLQGSDDYRNVRLNAALTGHALGQQRVYLRYDRRSYAYLSVTIADQALIVEQREPGRSPERLYDIALDGAEAGEPLRLAVTLAGSFLTVTVNDRRLVDRGEVAQTLQSGGIGLGAQASELNVKDDIYDAVFEGIKVEATDEEGKAQKLLYRNHYSGLAGLVSRMKHAVNAAFDWAIDTF